VPARYGYGELVDCGREYGWALWTFVTHALVHADLTHFGFNAVWLLAFGAAVARRFGAMRFLIFFALTATAGAVAHLISHIGEINPMIGASGAISGTMGAAARFAFQRHGPLDPWRADREGAFRIPAAPLMVAFRNPQVLGFVGAWFALNLLFGLGSWTIIGEDQTVAWEAHVGGFVVGLLSFPLFDPVGNMTDAGDDESEHALH
jgi:membrane associated rhomboid family serine protease